MFSGCGTATSTPPANHERSANADSIPKKILWAWERPDDLRFLAEVEKPKDYGVAFLAQTITIGREDISIAPRRQPLHVTPGTFMIAVTRIEPDRPRQPKLSAEQRAKIVEAVIKTLKLKDVVAVQTDFDVAVSERAFYKDLLTDLRAQIPPEIPFSMTALASWCTTKSWLEGLPVDEAVPMAFRMGADDVSIRGFLATGKDWRESMCQHSYGFAVDEPFERKLIPGRRMYLFNDRAWKKEDLDKFDY